MKLEIEKLRFSCDSPFEWIAVCVVLVIVLAFL